MVGGSPTSFPCWASGMGIGGSPHPPPGGPPGGPPPLWDIRCKVSSGSRPEIACFRLFRPYLPTVQLSHLQPPKFKVKSSPLHIIWFPHLRFASSPHVIAPSSDPNIHTNNRRFVLVVSVSIVLCFAFAHSRITTPFCLDPRHPAIVASGALPEPAFHRIARPSIDHHGFLSSCLNYSVILHHSRISPIPPS